LNHLLSGLQTHLSDASKKQPRTAQNNLNYKVEHHYKLEFFIPLA
jgi:hypothetical protein